MKTAPKLISLPGVDQSQWITSDELVLTLLHKLEAAGEFHLLTLNAWEENTTNFQTLAQMNLFLQLVLQVTPTSFPETVYDMNKMQIGKECEPRGGKYFTAAT